MSEVKNSAEVCVVHVIDTEGPLYESLTAKFDRLNDLFNISHLERTKENFLKLQNGEIDLGGVVKLNCTIWTKISRPQLSFPRQALAC